MSEKALTVAIAGALAAPVAAQAVDFTISGHLNRALFITDNDAGTSASVKDNASSGTRIRVTGSSEMETGATAGINLEYAAGGSLGLRYADIWYGGAFGKVSIGQGDQGGEGSAYAGSAATGAWIGHGMDQSTLTKDAAEPAVAVAGAPPLKGTLSNYFGSLDGGGGRTERIRYDTPALGPLSAAVSVGNGDQASASLGLSQEFAGTTFAAKVGTIQYKGDKSNISASAGVTLPAGLKISGTWGKGKDHAGMTIPGMAGTDEVPIVPAVRNYRNVWTAGDANIADSLRTVWRLPVSKGSGDAAVNSWLLIAGPAPTFAENDTTGIPNNAPTIDNDAVNVVTGKALGTGHGYTVRTGPSAPSSVTFDTEVTRLRGLIERKHTTDAQRTEGQQAAADLAQLFTDFACMPVRTPAEKQGQADALNTRCGSRYYDTTAAVPGTDAVAEVPAKLTYVDPTFYQVGIGYVFGNTKVGVSWYQSQDFMMKGSKGTAIGIGVNHALPKAAAEVYASVQNYDVTPMKGGKSMDDTVVMIGTRIKF